MSARKGKLYGLPHLRPAQPRAEPPEAPPTEERRLGGAFEVPIDQVFPDPDQPRRDWSYDDGERRLEELASSIREFGILQPLVVREDGALPDGRIRYVVIAGGRRRAAAERAGVTAVPVVVRGEEGARVRVLQLLENLQRQGLSPLDEARAYQELIDTEGISASALAARVHVSDQHVRSRLRLLADQVVSDAVERRQIPVSAAKVVLQLPDEEMFGLKERLAQGETLHMADVMAVRERLRANGVINPRFKGGGRASRSPVAPELAGTSDAPGATPREPAAPAATSTGERADQTVFDPQARSDDARAGAADQTVIDPSDLADPGDGGIANGADDDAAHPAVTALLAERAGANLVQALPPEPRERLAEALCELERRAPAMQWLTDLHRGLRRELGLTDKG